MEAYRELYDPASGTSRVFDVYIHSNWGHGIMAEAHYHDYVEILYCLTGAFEAQFGGRDYHFTGGDMVVIHSQEVHRMISLDNGMNEYAVLKFDPELLFSVEQAASELRYLLDFSLSAAKRRFFSKEELSQTLIPDLIPELVQEATAREYGYELAVRAGLCRLFLLILRTLRRDGADLDRQINAGDFQRLQAVMDYVESGYMGSVSLNDAAALAGMSYSAFSRFFAFHSGKSFTDYVADVRITKAKILLATSDRSITDIALETGFSTSSYFIQCFKSRNGIAPLQFRKNLLRQSS